MNEARKEVIEAEVDRICQAAQTELDKEMRDEGVSALKTAALKLAYTHKYLDMDNDKMVLHPSILYLLIGTEIYEEAEKHYYEPEDEYPLKYIAALKEYAYGQGAKILEDYDKNKIERDAVPVEDTDELLFRDLENLTHDYDEELDKLIKLAGEEELEGGMNADAVKALKKATAKVAPRYSSLGACLLDDTIFEEAKAHYMASGDDLPEATTAMSGDGEPVIRFRNYEPASEDLASLPKVEAPVIPEVEELVGTAEVVHNDATQEPLLNLAPKKANWDLKRDMEPQVKKLRGMTDRAIVELIRQRVAEESGEGADLSLAVEQQQRAEARADED